MNHTKTLLLIGAVLSMPFALVAGGKTSHSEEEEGREIPYTRLSPDAGLFHGVIIEDGSETHTRKLSFSGDTMIGGILKEHESSSNRISLAEFSELTVIDPFYKSERYPHKELALVRGTLAREGTTEEFLFPQNLIICGETKAAEKSWYLRSVQRILIKQGLDEKTLSTPARQERALLDESDSESIGSVPFDDFEEIYE